MIMWILCFSVAFFGTAALSEKTADASEPGMVLLDKYIDCASDESIRLLADRVGSLLSNTGCSSDDATPARSSTDLTKIGNNYYYISSKQVSWGNAYKYCLKNKLKLVSFEKEQEIKVLVDYLKKNGHTEKGQEVDIFWTSGTNLGLPGQYYWASTGEAVDVNEVSWWPSNPDGNQGVAFNYLHPSHLPLKYTIFNRPPNNAYKFVCEK